MGGGGVKNHRKLRDIIYGRPLSLFQYHFTNQTELKPNQFVGDEELQYSYACKVCHRKRCV
jgi:hypothetical protein